MLVCGSYWQGSLMVVNEYVVVLPPILIYFRMPRREA